MHDFDFLFGRWAIHNERLRERLVGCTEWEAFEATGECGPVLDGLGNIDSFVTDWRGGFRGMSLRLYDRERRRWSIYWAANGTGTLEPPVHGTFENGVGNFYGPDSHQGTPVLARLTWSRITPTSALWEQAYSVDDGKSWEPNWRMFFTRSCHM